ncbi:MAG: ATP-binding protein [Spirochaetales bacterium]
MQQDSNFAIIYKKKKLRELRLKIHPHTKIHQIVPLLNHISFKPSLDKKDHVSYALLELINNSLRAHREKKIQEPILVKLRGDSTRLQVEVKDSGGGFDPTKLPYDIFSSQIPENLHTDPFVQYRRIHENKRFGIGLLIAKKVFHRFHLEFVDAEGNPRSWGDPAIVGTRIRADIEPPLDV